MARETKNTKTKHRLRWQCHMLQPSRTLKEALKLVLKSTKKVGEGETQWTLVLHGLRDRDSSTRMAQDSTEWNDWAEHALKGEEWTCLI